MPEEILESTHPKWEECLVGYYIGKRLPFQLTEDALKNAWGHHLVEVIAADLGFYFFHIPDGEFRRKVLDGVPITVAKIPLILQQWHPMLELKKSTHNTVPIWVRLRNVPVALWSVAGISFLASGIDVLPTILRVLLKLVPQSRRPLSLVQMNGVKCVIGDPLPQTSMALHGQPELTRQEDHHPSFDLLPATSIDPGSAAVMQGQASPVSNKSAPSDEDLEDISSDDGESVSPCKVPSSILEERDKTPPPEVNQEAPFRQKGILRSESAEVSIPAGLKLMPPSARKRGGKRRGLGQALKQAEIRNFVRTNRLCYIGILETKISPAAHSPVSASLLPRWSWSTNYSYSIRGCIWVGWNPLAASFCTSACTAQAIHGRLECFIFGIAFNLSVVYAEHSFVLRRPLWNDLISTSSICLDIPWIVAGDFNDIRYASNGKRDSSNYLDSSLLKISRLPHPSWQRKIDRVLTNAAWISAFSYLEANFLAPRVSDHSPMVVRILPVPSSRKPFKFFNFWMSHPNFFELVRQIWELRIFGTPMFVLCSKLRSLKRRLKLLNREAYSDISARTSYARRLLVEAQDAIQFDPHNQALADAEKDYLRVFSDLRLKEESFYRQKSRVIWLKEGDLNTRFFHHSVKRGHLRNRILSISDGTNVIIDEAEVQQLFVDHFQNLFIAHYPPPFRHSVILVIREFFSTGQLLREINTTILTLVPKSPNASTVNDFRPIACCNTFDTWHPRGPFNKLFSDRDIYRSRIPRNASVATGIAALSIPSNVVVAIHTWDDPLPSLNSHDDRLVWLGHSSGQFSTAYAWTMLRARGSLVNWS
ncbi:uncharacterized protein LOC120294342 [Eucalyptus grandis]|uniref:uncharacterized protein LOC120294342 n=1 Tax=Eucalyptus grandis TaxID=71139 RepID=UPI00192EDD8A|nr:uncharacterized protein LOC120294342 [Eucalyptus grandis]